MSTTAKAIHRKHIALGVVVLFLWANRLLVLMPQGTPRSSVNAPLEFPESTAPSATAKSNPLDQVAAARREVEKNPNSAKAHLALGVALVRVRDNNGALSAFETAVRLDPREAQAWYLKGIIEAERTMWAAAAEDFRQAVEARPSYLDARIELGDMRRRTGHFDTAAREFRGVLGQKPKNALAHYDLGLVELQQGKIADAEDEFRKASTFEENFPEARESLAQTLLLEHDWAGAAVLFEQAVVDNPDSMELANGRAVALSHLGDPTRTAAAFETVRKVARRNLEMQRAETANTLGLRRWQAGDTAAALAAFQQAIHDAPDFAQAHYNMGRLQSALNHLNEAVEEYQAALHYQKQYPEALNNLGEAYARLGERDRAIRTFQQALKIRPGLATAHFNLGMALQEQGLRKEARKEFQETILLEPQTAAAHLELGLLFAQMDGLLSARARKELREGLRLNPRLSNLVPQQLRAQLQ